MPSDEAALLFQELENDIASLQSGTSTKTREQRVVDVLSAAARAHDLIARLGLDRAQLHVLFEGWVKMVGLASPAGAESDAGYARLLQQVDHLLVHGQPRA